MNDGAVVGPVLKVVSFNLRFGTADDGPDSWPFRRDLAIEAIRRSAPTMLGVQEALDFQLDEILQALPHLRAVGVGRDDGRRAGEHAAILYDARQIGCKHSRTLWFSETPEAPGSKHPGTHHPRVCTIGEFVHRESGFAFEHANLHLDNESEESRLMSVALLMERQRAAPPIPRILTGDFNCGEGSAPLAIALRAGYRDSFRAIHPDSADVGTYCGFSDAYEPEKIDHILVGEGFEVLGAEIIKERIGGRWPSDHALVTALLAGKL